MQFELKSQKNNSSYGVPQGLRVNHHLEVAPKGCERSFSVYFSYCMFLPSIFILTKKYVKMQKGWFQPVCQVSVHWLKYTTFLVL